jgi:hypothetical protein
MVDHLTDKDRNSPTGNKENPNLSSSGKEGSEHSETSNELTSEQIKTVKNLLKKADEENNGVVCDRDEVKYLTYLERDCTPEQRVEAIADLPEHLEKKAEYLQEYQNDIETHFSINSEITLEGKGLLEEYKDMTGGERKEAAKKLRVLIKERIQEKKSYQELLSESPHFSEDGQLTSRAQELFDTYQAAQPHEKNGLKKELLENIRQNESAEKRCEQFYKIASDLYERGQFFTAEPYLESTIELCDRYADSPRMQVIKEWNERDLINMKHHTEKQKEIKKLTMLREHYVNSGNINEALSVSRELTKKTERFLNYTIDRKGEEVVRKEKYKTRYLQDLYQDAWSQSSALLSVKMKQDDKRQSEERLEKSFHSFYNTTNQADDHTALLGVAEEETRWLHSDERTDEKDILKTVYVDNEDIEDFTEEDLNEKTKEREKEIAINFDNENDHERLMKVKESEEVNTGITRKGGRAVTNIEELENLVGKKTEKMSDDFAQYALATEKMDQDTLDEFHDNMDKSIATGEFGRDFTKETRKSGLDVVRFGDDFDRSQRELGEFVYDHAEVKTEKPNKIINLADEVRKQRQEQREAA